MNNLEKGYFAGILDGEGCIGLHKTRRQNRKSISYQYNASVVIGNTDKRLIDKLNKLYKAHTFIQSPQGWRKRCHVWKLSCNKVINFLRLISPYLIIKKKQAAVLLEYFTKIKKNNKPAGGGLYEDEMKIREKYYLRLKELNKKGPKL